MFLTDSCNFFVLRNLFLLLLFPPITSLVRKIIQIFQFHAYTWITFSFQYIGELFPEHPWIYPNPILLCFVGNENNNKFYFVCSSCHHEHNILELYNISEKLWFPTSKAVVDIQYKNIVFELPHVWPNDLGLGSLEISEYSENVRIGWK